LDGNGNGMEMTWQKYEKENGKMNSSQKGCHQTLVENVIFVELVNKLAVSHCYFS
jgi:hypothetical protein